KKPRPLIATSMALSVWIMPPWVNSFSVATTRTPVPRLMPVGSSVSCEVCPPDWRTFWYSRSSNTARPCLNPVVLTVARLFDTTDILVCCASSPVLAIHSAWFISCSPIRYSWAFSADAHQLRGRVCVFFRGLDDVYLHLVLPGQLDHVDQRPRDVHVALLQRARCQRDTGACHGILAIRPVQQARSEERRVGKEC